MKQVPLPPLERGTQLNSEPLPEGAPTGAPPKKRGIFRRTLPRREMARRLSSAVDGRQEHSARGIVHWRPHRPERAPGRCGTLGSRPRTRAT